ncbi:MAG: NAD-dependent protein deacetylase [Planctomycetota bacterium]|nr:MAG: NAD-dependent protein deacetylase [Planctomycetota bacterium]
MKDLLRRAADRIARAEGLVVCAGAGMGVDSGLPDFRGDEGFWRAYPPYRHLGVSFVDMANPRWFQDDPAFAWGFYGHRRNLYRATTPHAGFDLLAAWGRTKSLGLFVFTSNVDGQFQRAGFDPEALVECHGAIDFEQCLDGSCGAGIWQAGPAPVDVDEERFRAREPLPACPRCGGLARPNVLMFGDWGWNPARTDAQERRLEAWLEERDPRRLCVVECGAGTAVPSVRSFSERLAARGAALVRINPREPEVPADELGIAAGALAALRGIDEALRGRPPASDAEA